MDSATDVLVRAETDIKGGSKFTTASNIILMFDSVRVGGCLLKWGGYSFNPSHREV